MKDDSMNDELPRPYPPSWVDHLTDWVDQLPVPQWAFYVGFWLVLILILVIPLQTEGGVGPLLPVLLFMPTMVTFLLAMLHILGNRASKAIETLRPVLKTSQEEYSQLRYSLTTRPARPLLLIGIVLVGVIAVLEATSWPPTLLRGAAVSSVSAAIFFAVYLIGFWNFSALLYHTIHQMKLINHIYTEHTRINLFKLRPLYAFSSLAALTVVGIAIPTYGWSALVPPEPDPLSVGISVGFMLLVTILAVAAFFWPLLGVHWLLREEKGLLLDECAERLEAAIAELHRRVDSRDLKDMDRLNDAMASLIIERDALVAIPTWPWQPETPRLLITALALPLGLWIAQYVLQLILGS